MHIEMNGIEIDSHSSFAPHRETNFYNKSVSKIKFKIYVNDKHLILIT